MTKQLSGPEWVARFPTSQSLDALKPPFASCAKQFLAALSQSGATFRIEATLRPPERAYLMHYAFQIAHNRLDPAAVPPRDTVAIDWVHPKPDASVDAARQMVSGYGIVYPPALQSRHEEGHALDVHISWQGALSITDAEGSTVQIGIPPASGLNRTLWQVGKSFGVVKNPADPPHWSIDGH